MHAVAVGDASSRTRAKVIVCLSRTVALDRLCVGVNKMYHHCQRSAAALLTRAAINSDRNLPSVALCSGSIDAP